MNPGHLSGRRVEAAATLPLVCVRNGPNNDTVVAPTEGR